MFVFIMNVQEGTEIGNISQMLLAMEYFLDETSHNIYLSANVQRVPWYHITKDLMFTMRTLDI